MNIEYELILNTLLSKRVSETDPKQTDIYPQSKKVRTLVISFSIDINHLFMLCMLYLHKAVFQNPEEISDDSIKLSPKKTSQKG